MNNKLIFLLKNSDDYVSGEEISKIFGITRASVWKHIKVLKEMGYEIEGIPRKGYKLLSSPNILLKDEILEKLETKFIGRNIQLYDSLESTNKTAKQLARSSSAPDGTLIIAEEQKNGKGRFDRAWKSPKGGLWFSLILKPNIEPVYCPKLTQIAAATLVTILRKRNIEAFIKWPNDIYLNNKKICGILSEMKCDIDRIDYVVVGVGINVNVDINSIDSSSLDKITSLKIEQNKDFDRTELLVEFLYLFEKLYLEVVEEHDFDNVVSICREYSILKNKKVYLITSQGKEEVTCIGITDNGELLVRDALGNEKQVYSGEITSHK